MVFSPSDREISSVYASARVWVAPGEEGFGLAPLEAAVVGAMPVWTFDPEVGPDPSKPREFQVARSVEGVEALEGFVERPARLDLEEHGFTADAFLARFLHALGF
jgi:glycosyltransferase involved in cell wall biosynthesis